MRISRVKITSFLIALFILSSFACYCENIIVKVVPQHDDWTYKIYEKALFNVSVSGDIPVPFSVSYEVGPEKMKSTIKGKLDSSSKEFVIDGGTMELPGFLRCTVTIAHNDEVYAEYATAAFQAEDILPTVDYPDDFNQYWKETVADARLIPMDTKMTLLEDKCTDYYNVYEVSYQNYEYKNRSYGILTIPVKEGKYPAIIRFPGAGVHPSGGNLSIADKDVITLDLYIHPFPMHWKSEFYDGLRDSPYIEYKFWGASDRESYYYKRVITGCVKAVDLIFELPQFDGENLASWGSSQGGALSIITTSLDSRIKMLVALCPAMCDYTGYLHGRAGGWPHFFNAENIDKYNNQDVINTLPYYDVVNFARNISVPGFYSWGYNDETTPPTSFYSAYNVIQAPKKVLIIPEGKHRIYPEQREQTTQWIFESFNNK